MQPRATTASSRLPIPPPEALIPHAYVHMPFCVRKCPYCDFNSHAGRDREIDGYLEALAMEIEQWHPHLAARTIFVGGGTPTHGATAQVARLMEALTPLRTEALREFTIEANPGSLDRAKVRVLREGGVDRASVGVQTFHDRHLETLGRAHDASDAVRGLELLREGGMQRFSLDLILAVPGQELSHLARDLERAIDLDPEHVSAYVLTFEEGTAFTKLMNEGRLPAPEAERELAFLHKAVERLGEAGYQRYEISNFARSGAECEHNLAYWQMRDWVGIGAGAHGHVAGVRWKNVDDPAAYVSALREGRSPVAWQESSTPAERAFECLMMGLRLTAGVSRREIEERTGVDPVAAHLDVLQGHVELGLLEVEGDRLRLCGDGFDLLSALLRAYAPTPA